MSSKNGKSERNQIFRAFYLQIKKHISCNLKLMFTANQQKFLPRRIMGQFQSLLIELSSPAGSRRNRDAKVRRSLQERRRFCRHLQAIMAANENQDDSLYPIAVLIDELRNEDVQVCYVFGCLGSDRPHRPSAIGGSFRSVYL